MCDCYTAKCGGCGCSISMHIGDFCTSRQNVHPYCPRCTRKLKKNGIPKAAQIFEDTIDDKYQVDGGRKGQKVIILCDDPDAYGVYLN